MIYLESDKSFSFENNVQKIELSPEKNADKMSLEANSVMWKYILNGTMLEFNG